MYDHDYKLSKKRQLPTYAGYDIPAKVFTDLAFSFAHVRGKYLLGDLRTRLNASLVFNSLKQAPPHEVLYPPEFDADPDWAKKDKEDYLI
ncbi:hypothetical protein BDV98DRAFT_570659 [Pterulicium gracile]|uniref:Uncharacterized protein n=1 Tax=Pterulicium gracile TaxID=1884261 RepID=A0A5C3QMQ3_9AGAR|nr:hypothetical protein BDV98DRAFT_570659 [Pterula gracilis]